LKIEAAEANGAPDTVRTPQEIATRALALFAVVGLGFDANRDEVLTWLRDEDLYEELTPMERVLAVSERPTRKQLINASWQSEALIVLLWSLQKVEDLPPPNTQCDTSLFQKLLPPYTDVSAKDFVRWATRRSDETLTGMADMILNLHAKARDASLGIDIEIVQERHRAINWVIGYDGLPWDEVTTDT
jgi:hypothetical protein